MKHLLWRENQRRLAIVHFALPTGGKLLAALLLVPMCAGCGLSPSVDEPARVFDEAAAMNRAKAVLRDKRFVDTGDTSQCYGNCDEQQAGYDWARDHGYSDSSQCLTTDDVAFYQGCVAYTAALGIIVDSARSEAGQ